MDFLVSPVGRTLLNLKTFLDGTEMMEDSLYEGQIRYIPEEVKRRYIWKNRQTVSVR